MCSEKDLLLREIAYLYYIENKDQYTIAKYLNIHRSTVSRKLKEARETGLVEVKIKDFNEELFMLKRKAIAKFGLKFLDIVPSNVANSDEDINDLIGRQAANYIHHTVKNGDVIGLSWGTSVAKTIRYMDGKYTENTVVVPLVGGSTEINPSEHVNTLVYELSKKIQGKSVFINASAIQESPDLATGIINSKYFLELKSYWEKLDIAIVGIGGEYGITDSSWRYLLSEEDGETIKNNKCIGDCCCQFFDKKGNVLQGDLHYRIIGVNLTQLRELPISIGVAAGDAKVKAITALLINKTINSLITDEKTLRKIMSYIAETDFDLA